MNPLTNSHIAHELDELADLYELDGASVHRILAYRRAAKTVRDATTSVAEAIAAGRVTELPGIGKTIAEKLLALLEEGAIPAKLKLEEKFPPGILDVVRLPGLGPKRAMALYSRLGIDSLTALEDAASAGKLRELQGFGAKSEQGVLDSLKRVRAAKDAPKRTLLSQALHAAEQLVAELAAHPAAEAVEVGGSLRRLAETVKDIDIVAASGSPLELAQGFAELDCMASVETVSEAGAHGVTHSGLPVDLRVVRPESFGNLVQHFTGSGEHNAALRAAAVREGLHISEYGVLVDATGEQVTHRTERELYDFLGYSYIEPELREDRGELEAARNGELPELVKRSDLRGELHCHTVASDGKNTVEEMARAAVELGYEYLAITDHSASHGFGNAVSPDDLKRQIELVREVNADLAGIELLIGSEVNILVDGSLDYSDDLLAELDWVIASVHTSFRIDRKAMTERIVAAVQNPLVEAIGHPTGRLIGRRDPYEVDIDRVIEAAAQARTMLEINSAPERRDLSEIHARQAAEAGVLLLIDSDAHSVGGLNLVQYGTATARRAWLEPRHIANTRPLKEFLRLLKRTK